MATLETQHEEMVPGNKPSASAEGKISDILAVIRQHTLISLLHCRDFLEVELK